jgi:hypothetical protein
MENSRQITRRVAGYVHCSPNSACPLGLHRLVARRAVQLCTVPGLLSLIFALESLEYDLGPRNGYDPTYRVEN